MADNYKIGDHYLIDDRTGVKIRASKAKKEWTGAYVHEDVWEPRQPQDLVRSINDKPSAKPARPRPVDVFIGPLTTFIAVDAVAGQSTLTLESAVRMATNDLLFIILDSGDVHITTLLSVSNETDIIIARPLPGPASAGKQVTDNTAMAQPRLP